MDRKKVYYGFTTFSQRKLLMWEYERTQNISEACRRAKVNRGTFYRWYPRYEEKGIEGLREFESSAPKNPKTIDSEIEKRVVELKKQHPEWGKKRIADELFKEHGWKRVVNHWTVRKILIRHGLWKVKPKPIKKKRAA